MSFERLVLLASALLCLGLFYGLLTQPDYFFGNAVMSANNGPSDSLAATRLLAVAMLTVGVLNLMAAFDTPETRAMMFKGLLLFHTAMMLGNIYNFMTATVSGLAMAIHAVFAVLFLILVIRGPEIY